MPLRIRSAVPALLASALGIAFAAGCGSDSTPVSEALAHPKSESHSPPAASEIPSRDTPICDLLPARDVSELTDVTIAKATPHNDMVCEFADGEGNPVASYLIERYSTQESPQKVMKGITVNGDYEPISGIGDTAVYGAPGSLSGYSVFFTVRRDQEVVLVQTSVETDVPESSREMVENVAKALEQKV